MLESATNGIIDWLQTAGELTPLTALGLMGVFIVASLGVPRALLSASAGALFGIWSLVLIQPAVTIGAVLAFLISRHLLADRARRYVEARPVCRAIATAIDGEGWRIVALVRLASPIPSAVTSYLFGLTRISIWQYSIATLIFTLPQNILFVSLGAAGRTVLLEDASSPLQLGLLFVGLLCLAVVTLTISRKARAALRSHALPQDVAS